MIVSAASSCAKNSRNAPARRAASTSATPASSPSRRVAGAPPVLDARADRLTSFSSMARARARRRRVALGRGGRGRSRSAGRRPGARSAGSPSSRRQSAGSSNGEQMIGCGTSNSLIGQTRARTSVQRLADFRVNLLASSAPRSRGTGCTGSRAGRRQLSAGGRISSRLLLFRIRMIAERTSDDGRRQVVCRYSRRSATCGAAPPLPDLRHESRERRRVHEVALDLVPPPSPPLKSRAR